MPRRLVVVLTAATLAILAALPSHAALRVSGCLTLTDPQGDAEAPPAALYRPPGTPGVDILSATVTSDGRSLTMALTVGDIRLQPPTSTHTELAFDFVLRKTAFRVFAMVSTVPSPADERLSTKKGIQVFAKLASTNLDATLVGNTVRLTIAYSELERLAGGTVRGERVSQLGAMTTAYYVPNIDVLPYASQDFDTVAAPREATPVLGAACR